MRELKEKIQSQKNGFCGMFIICVLRNGAQTTPLGPGFQISFVTIMILTFSTFRVFFLRRLCGAATAADIFLVSVSVGGNRLQIRQPVGVRERSKEKSKSAPGSILGRFGLEIQILREKLYV